MARVYEARLGGLHGFEKHLAIKMMLPEYAGDKEFVTMLIDEAKIAVALNHSNICQIHDLGRRAALLGLGAPTESPLWRESGCSIRWAGVG